MPGSSLGPRGRNQGRTLGFVIDADKLRTAAAPPAATAPSTVPTQSEEWLRMMSMAGGLGISPGQAVEHATPTQTVEWLRRMAMAGGLGVAPHTVEGPTGPFTGQLGPSNIQRKNVANLAALAPLLARR